MGREGKFEACIPGNHGKREFPLTPASAWEIIWEWAPRPFAQICAEKIYIKRQKTSVRLLSTAVLQFGPMAGRLLWLRLVTGKRQFNAKAPKCVSWVEHWAGSRRLRVEQPRNLFLSSSCSELGVRLCIYKSNRRQVYCSKQVSCIKLLLHKRIFVQI